MDDDFAGECRHQFAGGRWPFPTGGPPVHGESRDLADESAAVAVVDAAAETLDADTLEVPTLNDRVDPDCIEPAVGVDSSSGGGVRIAIEVSFGEIAVVLDDAGRIEVYSDDERPNDLVPSETTEHDWTGWDSLYWTVATAVGNAAGEQPKAVAERLIERIDVEALDRLLRPLPDGTERFDSRLILSIDGYEVTVTPDGTVEIEPSLAVLRRSGAALLAVGALPEPGLDRASAALLGASDEHYPVFVLHGRDLDTADRRLSMAGLAPSGGTVLDLRATARSATEATTENGGLPTSEVGAESGGHPDSEVTSENGGQPDPEATPESDDRPARELEVVSVPGGITDLPAAVDERIGAASSFGPGELRVCVDSLGSMIESTDLETTREAIDSIRRTVRRRGGIGQFLLSVDPEDEEVRTLAPSFDAVVELRTGAAGAEQRWLLTGTGHETRWFPVQ